MKARHSIASLWAHLTWAFALVLTGINVVAAQEGALEVEVPQIVLGGVPFEVSVSDPSGALPDGTPVVVTVGGTAWEGVLEGGAAAIEVEAAGSGDIAVEVAAGEAGASGVATANAIPGWLSIVPALLAIVMALTLRQVIPALVLGVWIGGSLAYGLTLSGLWSGLLDTISVYTIDALNDWGHIAVIVFSLMIGGMVGIVSRNGGTLGIVDAIIHRAHSPRRGQLTTGALGAAIFFDDYANTLIVGNTMRPITDRLKVSREKLAYIVDSTAAPVATIALVTTWIGFQVGLIDEAVAKIEGITDSAYAVFLNSLLYNFYPLLAIIFVFLVAGTGRDFGPMLHAERRARTLGLVSRPDANVAPPPEETTEGHPDESVPRRAMNAVIPVLILVFGTLIGIYVTGAEGLEEGASFREIIGNGDSYTAMLWSSFLAVIVAGAMSIAQRILSLGEVVEAWYAGVRAMLMAVIILVLAWTLAAVNDVLHTGDFLVSVLGDTVPAELVPATVFVLSALTAFATGSSWGVMGIMMPLVIPLTWAVMEANGLTGDPANMHILYASTSAVLAGAVWGDHCSPISDTTILSSLASECDHVDHVRTQMPYAIAVAIVALATGTIPVAYGLPWWLGWIGGIALLVVGLWAIGRRADEPGPHVHAAAPAGE